MIQKSIPSAVIDRQRMKLLLDGVELPYFLAERGPHTRPYGEGLHIVWVPVLVNDVEDIPVSPTRVCPPEFWASPEAELADDYERNEHA
jgi:hypothetical protein